MLKVVSPSPTLVLEKFLSLEILSGDSFVYCEWLIESAARARTT